jgi:hypothetical protein
LDILTCALQHYRFLQRENNRTIAQGVPSGWRNNAYQSQQEKYSFGGFEFLVEYKNENGTLHISFADKILRKFTNARHSELKRQNFGKDLTGILFRNQ